MKTNAITIYQNESFGKIRTTLDSKGKMWLCAKDICDILGYGNCTEALKKHVVGADLTKREVRYSHGGKLANFVNESGLYSLIMGSKMPKAKAFKHWVTSEVLPSIRKHGCYMPEQTRQQVTLNGDLLRQIAQTMDETDTELEEVRRENVSLQEQIEIRDIELAEVEKSKKFIESFMDNGYLFTITQIAKNYGLSGMGLNKLLEDHKVQWRVGGQYVLCSGYENKGYTQTIMVPTNNTLKMKPLMKWTMKGMKFIDNLLKTMDIVPIKEREEGSYGAT